MCRFASILVLAVPALSCGNVSGPAADAGDQIDADITDGGANLPDADPRGSARVNVHSYDGLHTTIIGAPVVFVDPDGTEVLRTVTDSMGRASADILPGASVTVVQLNAQGADLRTVVGIEPGDDIVLGARRIGSPAAGTMTFSWPIYAAAGGVSYIAYTQCGVAFPGAATSVVVNFQEHCRPDTVEFLVIVNAGGYVAYKSGSAAFANGTLLALTGPWTPLGTATVGLTGVTPDLAQIEVMWRNVNDGTFWRTTDNFSEAGATTGSVTPQNAPGYGTVADVTTLIYPDSTDRLQLQVRRVAGSPATFDIDLASSLLPWVGDTTVDPTARSVTATVNGTGTWDLTRFWIQYQRMVNTEYYDYTWVLYAPGGTTGLTLAELPTDLAGLAPQASDAFYGDTALVEVDTLTEDQVRQLPDETFGDEFCDRYQDYNGTSWRYFEAPPITVRFSGVPFGD